LDIQSGVPRNSSSLPSVFRSRDHRHRKSGVLVQRHQLTDSAISVLSLDDNDDIISASSSTSSRLSLLQPCATPTPGCDVTSGHVTPVARLRRGMTPSGDDLYPARMRSSLSMTTCPIDHDVIGRPTADDVTKLRDEPSEPTSAIHRPFERAEQQQEAVVSVSGETERGGRVNGTGRRQLYNHQRHVYTDDDSGRSPVFPRQRS